MKSVMTCFGDLPEYGGEFVLSFGTGCPDAVPPENRLILEDLSEEGVARASAVEPRAMLKGLIFLFPDGGKSLDHELVSQIQMTLVHRYYKYVYFPQKSLSAPDPHQIRKADKQQEVPEIVRHISGLKNTPYTLRYPVVDKLAILRMGLPVLLLLPGPSLGALEPVLPELAKRCLTICVSRSLNWCLEQGVQPDFVIQLDTYLVQQHFYRNIPPLPNTVLVPISIAPVHRYAHLFRGLFFMDSFSPGVVPNLFRLRESHVSTLMACLGLAECLHSPHCYIAGADLSSTNEEDLYSGSGDAPEVESSRLMRIDNHQARLTDSYGHRVYAPIRFLATAVEADIFAEDIAKETGTRFHNLCRSGLLSRRWFPPATQDEVLAHPPIDRTKTLRKLDKGLNLPEKMHLRNYYEGLEQYIHTLQENLHYLQGCSLLDDDGLRNHAFSQFTSRLRDYFPPDQETRDRLAVTLTRRWVEAARQARAWAALNLLRQSGKAIPVVCLPGEDQSLADLFAPLFPERSFRFLHFYALDSSAPDDPDAVDEREAIRRLAELDAALVSQKAHDAFHYFFDVYPEGNLLYFEPIFLPRSES